MREELPVIRPKDILQDFYDYTFLKVDFSFKKGLFKRIFQQRYKNLVKELALEREPCSYGEDNYPNTGIVYQSILIESERIERGNFVLAGSDSYVDSCAEKVNTLNMICTAKDQEDSLSSLVVNQASYILTGPGYLNTKILQRLFQRCAQENKCQCLNDKLIDKNVFALRGEIPLILDFVHSGLPSMRTLKGISPEYKPHLAFSYVEL